MKQNWKRKQIEYYRVRYAGEPQISPKFITLSLPSYYTPVLEYEDQLLGNVKKLKVLDLGCGEGIDSHRFHKKNAHVVSSDISLKALKNLMIGTDKIVCDAENLCFKNNTFDIVFGRAFLHHLPNPRKCISESYRVLKSNGYFMIIEPLAHNPLLNVGRKWREKYDGRLREQHPFHYKDLPTVLERVFGNVEFKSFFSLVIIFQAIQVFLRRYLHSNWDILNSYSIFYPLDEFFTNKFPRYGRIQVCVSRKQ